MSPLVDASSKMKVLLLLVTAGFTVCEKLDRTYLPPPGSKFSGGSPGDIRTPLEFPKEFPSRLTQTANNGLPTLDDPRIELGINRGLETATVSTTPLPATYFQSSPRVPSTTTSYAFSQTTTFPVDSSESTTPAVTSNFPTTGPVNYYQEHVGSKLPHPSTNPEYHQVFGQSLNRSQIVQPIFGTTDIPIYGFQPATKNNHFYPGLNVQENNHQQTIPTNTGTKPSHPNTFESFNNSYKLGNIHDTSKIPYPSNSYLPVKQNNQVNNVDKQYQQQHYRRPISRYPAAQISQSVEERKEAANLSKEPNTVFPILTSEFSEQSVITPSNYVTNLSSSPSEAYPTSIYQELPHQTSLPGIKKIDSSSLPDVYSDSSSGTGFQNIPAKENLNQFNSNENNFRATEISQKPLSYDYTQRTVNKFSHPEYYSTTAVPISPVQFTGNYPSSTLNNQIPSTHPSELVPGSVNKPLIYKTKSTPSPFHPPIVSTYPSSKGILTPAPVFEPTNVAFENRPTDVSIFTQSPMQLLHTTNQAYSTTSTPDVTNVPSNIGDSSRERQSFFVPTADNTQYPLKSLIQPSYSIVHTDHSDSPQRESDRNAVILNYENVITPDGFKYSYDTSNGIHAEETGTANNGVKATGGFSYTGDDGKVYSITYSADENGFRPSGDHLPTPPPIPEAILRMLEQNSKDEEAGIFDDGSYNVDKYGHQKYQGTNDYDLLQPVYRRPSTNIPQSSKQKLDTIDKDTSDVVNLTKPREHNIEEGYVDEEDQNEHGVPVNFVPSKYMHNKNEPIKNGTIIRKIGKPTSVDETIGQTQIELDFKYPSSSDLNKYLPTPSDIIKDDTKSSVTNQRLEQRKPIDKKPENIKKIKNILDSTKQLDLTNRNQYEEPYKNNGFKPTKGESKNNYKINYEHGNEGPMVNYNKDIAKFTTDHPYQEIMTNKPLERGYEYKPPQNNYFPTSNAFQMRSSVGEVISTTRPFNSRKETAIKENKRKPFMTPNVYREDDNDKYYSSGSHYKNMPNNPEYLENEDYDNGSQVTDSETLTSTSRRPEYGTTSVPTTNFETFTPGQKGYNSYVENKNTHSKTQEPGEDSSSTTLTPLRGSVKFESASSPKDTDVSQLSNYPATVEPLKGPRITGYPSSTDSTIVGNSFDSAPQKLTHDNVPSTTFRPNYTIFQENRPGGLNVDAYGRPIETESYDEGPIEPRPKHGKHFQPGSLLGKGSVDDRDFYPSGKVDNNEQVKQQGPNVGKGVKVTSYPSSFVTVKGENFSGPSRNQKFDPQIGYYYK